MTRKPQPPKPVRSLLVWRPASECRMLRATLQGWQVLCVPAYRIEIHKPGQTPRWGEFNKIIVTSPNAVRALRRIWAKCPWPAPLSVFCPGLGTASAMRRWSKSSVIVPNLGASMADLIQLPNFQKLHGERLIVLGAPGSNSQWIDDLKGRGADIDVQRIYSRAAPRWTQRHQAHLRQAFQKNAVTLISSMDSLQTIEQKLDPSQWQHLRTMHVLATSDRIEQSLRIHGFKHVFRIASAQTQDVASALQANSIAPLGAADGLALTLSFAHD